MKALQISKNGVPAEVVQLVDIPELDAPKANEVLVAVEYAPINQSEQLNDTCLALECADTNCYFFCMR